MANILIIDDDAAIRTVFQQFLLSRGHSVQTASEGKEGLKKMADQSPDLIITDIMMPEMDGLEVVQHIRDTCPGLPVIAISGGMTISTMNFLPLAEKFGACKVLEKPVRLTELAGTVDELLNKPAP